MAEPGRPDDPGRPQPANPVTAEPAPAATDPTVAWEPPATPDPAPIPGSRPASKQMAGWMLALAWVTGMLIVGFGAWIAVRASDSSGAVAWGYAVGAVLWPFVIAAVLRFVWTRLQGGNRPVLRSPWIPLGAAVIAAIVTGRNIGQLAPPPPVDATTAMHVQAPFTLRETESALARQLEEGLRQDASFSSVAVREVVGGDGSVSMLVAADGRLREGDLDEIAEGMQESSGIEPTILTIGGEQVATVSGPDGSLGSWVDAPLLISVYAPDTATLHAVIESVLGSG